jgi:hypothetical protein
MLLLLLGEHRFAQRDCALQSFRREYHGFNLADRISDQPLLMQPAERVPVEPFPGTLAVVQRQREQRQHRVVDLVGIEVHGKES